MLLDSFIGLLRMRLETELIRAAGAQAVTKPLKVGNNQRQLCLLSASVRQRHSKNFVGLSEDTGKASRAGPQPGRYTQFKAGAQDEADSQTCTYGPRAMVPPQESTPMPK